MALGLDDRAGGVAAAGDRGLDPGGVRLLAAGFRLIGQVDVDGDGTWDHQLTRNTLMTVKPGPVGIVGLGGSFTDDYRLFDGVIADDIASPPAAPGRSPS